MKRREMIDALIGRQIRVTTAHTSKTPLKEVYRGVIKEIYFLTDGVHLITKERHFNLGYLADGNMNHIIKGECTAIWDVNEINDESKEFGQYEFELLMVKNKYQAVNQFIYFAFNFPNSTEVIHWIAGHQHTCNEEHLQNKFSGYCKENDPAKAWMLLYLDCNEDIRRAIVDYATNIYTMQKTTF